MRESLDRFIDKLQNLYIEIMEGAVQLEITLSDYHIQSHSQLKAAVTKAIKIAKYRRVSLTEKPAQDKIILIGENMQTLCEVKREFERDLLDLNGIYLSNSPTSDFLSMKEFTTTAGIILKFGCGNIAGQSTDAIVNPCNEYLTLTKPGVGITFR